MKLEKEEIIDAAFALLEEKGIDQFNLRGLAARLSVSATALYWHFKDKGELLWEMSGRIYRDAYAVMEDEGDWHVCLYRFGNALRDSLGTYRDAARLCVLAKPALDNPTENAAYITRPLIAAGLSREDALSYEAVLTSYVLGWSIYQQNPAMRAFLSELLDYENSFDVGLNAIIEGFTIQQARLRDAAADTQTAL